jgi:transcriptional regulator with XRE-family HTH domain
MTTKKNARSFMRELVGENVSFAMVIRSYRESEEMSQVDFAKKLGISKAHLCDIEKRRRFVSATRAAEFAKKMGYPPTYMIKLALQDDFKNNGLPYTVDVGDNGQHAHA